MLLACTIYTYFYIFNLVLKAPGSLQTQPEGVGGFLSSLLWLWAKEPGCKSGMLSSGLSDGSTLWIVGNLAFVVMDVSLVIYLAKVMGALGCGR